MVELPLASGKAPVRRTISPAIKRELVDHSFDDKYVTLGGAVGVLLQGALCYVHTNTRWLVYWSVVTCLVMLACAAQEYAFRHRRDREASTESWERWYVIGSCFKAGVFAIGGAAAIGGVGDSFTRLILYGAWNAYVMGGAMRNAYYPLAARCYIGFSILPIVAVILWHHDIPYFIYLVTMLMFAVTILKVARTSYEQTLNFLQVDEERVKLVEAEARANKELAAANEQLGALARIDGLTNIPNRRAFDERLVKVMAGSRRDRQPVSLLLSDIDWFKKYNDRYGHQAGDECLRRVAQALEGCMRRPADQIARYGGEEFVALLPNTDDAGAAVVSEMMRDAVQQLGLESEASTFGVVTLSIGAATASPGTLTGEELLRSADDALYTAKENGRNQVIDGRRAPELVIP